MKLYFNGCSSTYGDELEDPATEAWPVLVAKHHGCEFLNDAVPGGSNLRTWSKTIANLDHYDQFYIQWSLTNRFTLYDPANQWEINFTQQLSNRDYQNKDYYLTFGKYYYVYWNNLYINYVNWLTQIVSLQSLLREKQKPYLMIIGTVNISLPFNYDFSLPSREQFGSFIHSMINIDTIPDDMLDQWYNTIQSLINQIDLSRFVRRAQWALDSIKHNHLITERHHMSASGHIEQAETIIEYERLLNDSTNTSKKFN
jgi:hypothetical protein